MKKSTLAVLGALGGAAYAGFNAAGQLAYQKGLYQSDEQKQAGIDRSVKENTDLENFWFQKQPQIEWQIQSFDGLNLSASFLPNPHPQNRLAILAHGMLHSREQMIPYAKMMLEMGFDVLMPDARAYGKSEGHLIGYGWLDRYDYQRWVAVAVDQLGADVQIMLMGISMGAATVMAASGEPLPGQICGVIEDSGYSDLYSEAKYLLHHHYHLPTMPLIPAADRRLKQELGYGLREADILGQVAKGGYPLLIIHGDKDQTVPVTNAHRLYAQLEQPKMIYIDPDAGHVQSIRQHPNHYREAVQDFVNQTMD